MGKSKPKSAKKKRWNTTSIFAALFVIAFGILCGCLSPATHASATLWALFPPVVAIGLALITKEVYSSLFV